jgi:CheY-like chemotaxis protein
MSSTLCHHALIVEDDPKTAAELGQYVGSLGHTARIVHTLEGLEAALAKERFCYALLDKQLPAAKGCIPVLATGDLAQNRLRTLAPDRNGDDFHVFPILVITGFSRELAFVNENLVRRRGDAFIPKPCDAETLTREVLAALERAGHSDHAACVAHAERPRIALPVAAGVAADEAKRGGAGEPLARVELDGLRIGQRTSFLVNKKRRDLQDRNFYVFFRACALRARGSEAFLSAAEIGFARAPHIPSRIEERLEGLLPDGLVFFQKGEENARRLHPRVHVEPIDYETFSRHPYPAIQKFADAERKRRS